MSDPCMQMWVDTLRTAASPSDRLALFARFAQAFCLQCGNERRIMANGSTKECTCTDAPTATPAQ
jgi:hypothetical protein